MTLQELVDAYAQARAPGWVVLQPSEILNAAIEAVQFYSAYGDIRSLSQSSNLPSAGDYVSSNQSETSLSPPFPIRDLSFITPDVELTAGEWAVIRPLFGLYVERENAQRLEASRSLGVEVYGRQVSEIAGDIERMESPEGLPARAFVHSVITVD